MVSESVYGIGFEGAPDIGRAGEFGWLHFFGVETREVVIVSPGPSWYVGHWYGGRMRPCGGEKCAYCDQGVGRQRRWLCWVYELECRSNYVWEFGDTVCALLRKESELRGGFKGLYMKIARKAHSKNARLEIDVLGVSEEHYSNNGDLPELRGILEATWASLG